MKQEDVLDFLKRIADGISIMFGNNCEVVIHDIENFESSIVYIKNKHVTQRDLGDEFNVLGTIDVDTLFKGSDLVNHKGVAKNNHLIKSSTFHVEGENYHYAFGINYDYTNLSHAQAILNELTQVGDSLDVVIKRENRIEQTLEELYDKAVAYIGKPVQLMKKDERVRMIGYLDDNGAFLIHKSIPDISEKMNISRFTIYNYLKEIRE